MQKIGLLVGREWSFPPALIGEIARRDAGVTAELLKLGGTRMDEPVAYAVIIDRISHEVPYYRSFLKHALLQNVAVVNNPFMWSADDKFFGAALITKLGIATPRTMALPNKDYPPDLVLAESLRNLVYPLDWEGIADYVGMPCVLKVAHGSGWKDGPVCHTVDELIRHYNTAGRITMVVQEHIQWERFVRCICIGQNEILPLNYDPRERKYQVEQDQLDAATLTRIIDDSRRIVRALDYDMNAIEWAIRDGVAYAVDFMNPAPDLELESLTPHYFDWAVQRMADLSIRLAHSPRLPRVQFPDGASEARSRVLRSKSVGIAAGTAAEGKSKPE